VDIDEMRRVVAEELAGCWWGGRWRAMRRRCRWRISRGKYGAKLDRMLGGLAAHE
jgi:hypothetical protein